MTGEVFEARHLIGGLRSEEGETFESRSTRDGSLLATGSTTAPRRSPG